MKDLKPGLILLMLILSLSMILTSCIYKKPSSNDEKPGDGSGSSDNNGGNDAGEDGAAATLGLPVFLLTDCLIERPGVDTAAFPRGGYPALIQWLENL